MVWKVILLFFATIVAPAFAPNIWMRIRFGGPLPPGGIAMDALGVKAMLHSPLYWLIVAGVAVILFFAGWLLKHWLTVLPK